MLTTQFTAAGIDSDVVDDAAATINCRRAKDGRCRSARMVVKCQMVKRGQEKKFNDQI